MIKDIETYQAYNSLEALKASIDDSQRAIANAYDIGIHVEHIHGRFYVKVDSYSAGIFSDLRAVKECLDVLELALEQVQ